MASLMKQPKNREIKAILKRHMTKLSCFIDFVEITSKLCWWKYVDGISY